MRIEVDPKTEELLEEIKLDLHVYGKGHANTISALILHYRRTKDIDKVLEEKLRNIDKIVESSFRKTAQNFVLNLFKDPDR